MARLAEVSKCSLQVSMRGAPRTGADDSNLVRVTLLCGFGSPASSGIPKVAPFSCNSWVAMAKSRFLLEAKIETDNPKVIEPILRGLVGGGSMEQGSNTSEFHVRAQFEGESAKDLNRSLLSALRRVEKKTRVRAQWTSSDGTVYRFFDYVLKSTT
jgi:hypothetical protein